MDYLFQDGGKPKAKKSKIGTKSKTTKSKTTKSKTTKSKTTKSKTTKSKTTKSKTGAKKGGNFLGSIGELVAPTGWGSFATTAALLAIDRADAAFRRKKEKNSGTKMSGGENIRAVEFLSDNKKSNYWKTKEGKENERIKKEYLD